MKNQIDIVGVCSRSFSKNIFLRGELMKKYKNVKFNDEGLKLEGKSLVDFLTGCSKAIIALETVNEEVLKSLPNLKLISKYGVGLDMIDMDALKKYNVKLGWIGGVNRRSVSELVISLSIALLRKTFFANREVISGKWEQIIGSQLSYKTFGIIGLGFIGKDLVRLLEPYECNILINDINVDYDFCKKYKLHPVNIEELLEKSDIVSIHTPLDASTKNILNDERLSIMKKSAILINLARGGLIDERKVASMLKNGDLLGAAFDVFNNEPPDKDNELLKYDNFISIPHIGGSSIEAITAMGIAAIESLDG